MKYHIVLCTLGTEQLDSLNRAIQFKTPLTLTLSPSQFNGTSHQLPITSMQLEKINKSKSFDESCKLEFHLLQVKELAQVNFNQTFTVDLIKLVK